MFYHGRIDGRVRVRPHVALASPLRLAGVEGPHHPLLRGLEAGEAKVGVARVYRRASASPEKMPPN